MANWREKKGMRDLGWCGNSRGNVQNVVGNSRAEFFGLTSFILSEVTDVA